MLRAVSSISLAKAGGTVAQAMVELADSSGVECEDLYTWDGTPDCQTSFPTNTPRVGMSLKRPGRGTSLPSED